ncbi:endonuclease V [Thermococcus sp. M36]|uniref:endonuclease V n=1 Tax=Thermococcus sp. M36 TaxID=1638261 RepID=UPI00143B3CB7|nr:endonuclease V [Thermococcus sp. M36]NJE06156.1 endonuclease V [Thermococcus sp. M36]
MVSQKKFEIMAKVQRELSRRIVERRLGVDGIKTIAAVDVSYRENLARAAFVLCSFPDCKVLKEKVVETSVGFPYIPTFFFLRETRPVLLAIEGESFDVLLVEGHGKAHPRGYGLASHVGLLTGRPTIGVAKKPLRGAPPGSFARVGKAYVSVGHLIDLESAVRIVEALLENGYPKPLLLADRLTKRERT